jgi:hypothetical protein
MARCKGSRKNCFPDILTVQETKERELEERYGAKERERGREMGLKK